MDARAIAELAMVAVFLVWLLAATVWVLHALVNHIRDEAKKRPKSSREAPNLFTNPIPPTPPAVPRIHVNDKGDLFREDGDTLVKLRENLTAPPIVLGADKPAKGFGINMDAAAERHTAIWVEGENKWRRVSKYRYGVTVTIETEELTLIEAQAVGSAVDAALYEALDEINEDGCTDAE